MEALVPLLDQLFTETDSEKRKQVEATLDQAGFTLLIIIIAQENEKLFFLLLQVITSPLSMDPQSK